MSTFLPLASPLPLPPLVRELATTAKSSRAEDAVALLAGQPDETVAAVLAALNPAITLDILEAMDDDRREAVRAASSPSLQQQWTVNAAFPLNSIGRLMEPVYARFLPSVTVAEAIEILRELVRTRLISYAYVVDEQNRMLGILTMRDLLFAETDQTLEAIMIKGGFSIRPELPLRDAMKLVLDRHYPAYPVCGTDGVLLGLVRGQAMFEESADALSAQAGSMVGVGAEERLSTPLAGSLKLRHPWLQLNLLTAFLAAAVVGAFQGTIDRLVILAIFLPVLAGQSGNTGSQALAVTLRGMTLGDLRDGSERRLVAKEAMLGLLNGFLVGLSAALGMFIAAHAQGAAHPVMLALVVLVAMVGSCIMSGICGALVPLTLRRFGFDPATASSIFLTTATDVVSMGLLLGLAALMVP